MFEDIAVLRVNDSRVSYGELYVTERLLGLEQPTNFVIDRTLIEQYARAHLITANEEEWKEEVNIIRKELNLYGAEECE